MCTLVSQFFYFYFHLANCIHLGRTSSHSRYPHHTLHEEKSHGRPPNPPKPSLIVSLPVPDLEDVILILRPKPSLMIQLFIPNLGETVAALESKDKKPVVPLKRRR
jgi:hypothetical protein